MNVSLNFTITDGVATTINYTIYLDGSRNGSGQVQNGTATIFNLTNLAHGSHIVIVEALDLANNTVNSTSINITVDPTNPNSLWQMGS